MSNSNSNPSSSLIQIYTFGTLQVVRAAQTVTESDWHTRQARQLLKILITERPRPVSTDRLIDLLWPNSKTNAASTTLRSAINALRNVLEPDRRSRAPSKYIITEAPGYAFHNHADIWLDVENFETVLKRADTLHDSVHDPAGNPVQRQALLEEAIDLYQDDYLTSDPYADWAQGEREQLRERYFATLLTVASLRAEHGNYTTAIAACRRIIARDPVRENAYQALMRYQAESGDSASALLTYERCRAILAEELGADPSPLTQAWHSQILNGEIGPQQIDQRREHHTATATSHLPAQITPTKIELPVQALTLASDRRNEAKDPRNEAKDPIASDTASAIAGRASFFVGRTTELTMLAARLAQAKAGTGSLLMLDGEAGVGKTHLAYHFLQQAVGPTLTVIHTTCQPLEQQLPFAALSDGLGRYLHTLPANLLQAFPVTSMAQLAQLTPSLQDRLPDLPVPAFEAVANSDENRQRLINGLIALLTTLAEARPLLFFIDDAQWADTETLAVLGRLAQRLPQLPMFLLVAFRSGEIGENQALETLLHTLRRMDPHIVHRVQRFDRAEVQNLVSAILGAATTHGQHRQDDVVALLHEATQGNPLFLTEALHALQERQAGAAKESWDALVELSQAATTDKSRAAQADHLGLVKNPRVQEIILERLHRLPTPARNLLHLCAVIGRDFSLDLLEQIATVDPTNELVTELELLLQRNFLVEWTNDRIDFSHQIVRQVAYDHMSVLQRRRLHLRVAEAQAASRRALEIPGEIAFHYRQTGGSANTLVAQFSVLAGERLLHAYGFQQAVDCFNEALTLLSSALKNDRDIAVNSASLERISGNPPQSEEESSFQTAPNLEEKSAIAWSQRALQGLGLAYESLFEPTGITNTYRQLQQLARLQGDRRLLLTAYSRQTSMLSLLGQQRESNEVLLELLEALVATAESDDTATAGSATVMRDLFRRRQAIYRPDTAAAVDHWTAYQPPAAAVAEPVRAIRAALEPVHAVLPLFEYGWALVLQGQLTEGVHCLEAAVTLARETDQPSIAGIAYHLLAVAARMGGDLEQCYQLNEQSLAMNRRLQGRAGELVSMWPRIGSGFAALQLGNLEEAGRRFHRVADFLADLDAFRNHYNSATIGLGLVALARGEPGDAQRLLQQALDDHGNLYPYTHTQALLGLAQLAEQRGDSADCRVYLQRALAFAGERCLLEEYIEALLVVAHLMPTAAPTAVLLSDMLTYVQQLGLTAFTMRLEDAQRSVNLTILE